MSVIGSNIIAGASGTVETGYQISRSLRFNSADTANLSRTPASAGNRTTWTWSGWVKRGSLSTFQNLFTQTTSAGTANFTDYTGLFFDSDNTLVLNQNGAAGSTVGKVISSAVFRDVSAWYHIVAVWDTGNATAADRLRLYVNGVRLTVTTTTAALNLNSFINTAALTRIGLYPANVNYPFDGYMADVIFIDGQALEPTSFGQTDSATGVWVPKAYTGTYGTNGFWLKFDDNSGTTSTTLGKDSSGNSNNWTPNNFSVTAGVGNDSLVDSPTNYGTDTGAGGEVRGNYATLNPLDQITGRSDLSNGNLQISTGSATDGQARSTFAIPSSGKYYFEATVTSGTSTTAQVNVGLLGQTSTNTGSFVSGMYSLTFATQRRTVINGTLSSNAGTALSANDVIQVAVDMSTGNGWVGLNNTWFDSSNGTTGNPATGANPTFTGLSTLTLCGFGWTYNNTLNFNFGQRPFAYTAPSGFKALCTTNLPTPAIGASSTTLASQQMNIALWTGNGAASRAITGLGFSPDLVWYKARSSALSSRVFDSVRGANKELISNLTDAEATVTTELLSFDSDGFTIGSEAATNGNGTTFVGWAWRGSDSSAVSNTAGSITSTVSANQTAGISVVTYTGNGALATIGHGLGAAPRMIIVKNRGNGTIAWVVYHVSTGKDAYLQLNATNASTSTTNYWGSANPTSTVFGADAYGGVNSSANTYVAYCFAEVAGFSRFGSYTGNGSADGPFVFTGFRPRWVLIKSSSDGTASNDWAIIDAARNTFNESAKFLRPNLSAAEGDDAGTSPAISIDILSNGFKVRGTSARINTSSSTYIFAAFGESPFNYSRAR